MVTSLHWHGMHLPARMDGGPHQPIAAGATWTPSWQIRQPAATLWYHPHPHGATEQQVAKGLAGLFLLDDPTSKTGKALPHDYGVDDVPVVVQDKSFDSGGHPKTVPRRLKTIGNIGDQVLANGKVGATFTATTELVRFRLLNGSTARIYHLGFRDNRAFRVVAGDGGLLDAPRSVRRVTMSPGDRLDVVVAVKPGDHTILRDFPVHLADPPNQHRSGGDDTLDVMQLRGADQLKPSQPVPQQLAHLTNVTAAQAVKHRSFALEIPDINHRRMDMKRIDFAVTAGTSELWTLRNVDDMPHNFHVHDVQYRVLSLNGKKPPVEMQGRQDTVLLKPGDTIRLLISFGADYADPNTPYMFHCHMLWHEDLGMMGQFVVVRPHQHAGAITAHQTGMNNGPPSKDPHR